MRKRGRVGRWHRERGSLPLWLEAAHEFGRESFGLGGDACAAWDRGESIGRDVCIIHDEGSDDDHGWDSAIDEVSGRALLMCIAVVADGIAWEESGIDKFSEGWDIGGAVVCAIGEGGHPEHP